MKVVVAIFLCSFSPLLHAQQKDSLKVEIKNIGSLVNSSYSDYSPQISSDGSTMLFTSRRPLDNVIPSAVTNNKKGVKNSGEKNEGNETIYITYFNDKNETWMAPAPLEPLINLPGTDNSAIALSNDGQKMLLYRGGNNKNINRGIFESLLNGNEWSIPVRLPSAINSDGSETSASFSPDGRTIYFSSNRKGGFGGKDIWYCTQDEEGKWAEAVNMGESINSKEDEESVFIHPNGSTLFFSSKGHNSIGGYDIFMSNFDSTTNAWAKAVSLGTDINTSGDDLYFVMAANEQTGYYASAKPKGFGNKDIYSIRLGADNIKTHVTLLKGFVTGENELGIKSKIVIKNKSTGKIINTLSSNSTTGKYLVSLPINNEYEIIVTDNNNGTYSDFIELSDKTNYNEIVKNIVLEPKFATVFGSVLDEKGNPISNVQLDLTDIITGELIGKFETNNSGNARFSISFEKKFNIVFSKFGYFFQSVNVTIPKSNGAEPTVLKTITMQKVEVGNKTVVHNIPFDFNQTIPEQASIPDLDRLVTLMNNMASLEIEISGHTDNAGFQDKKKLSEQKAKSVMNYLINKGCDKNRMKYKGYGLSEPIMTNATEEGRQANNRIEIKVLQVDLIAEQLAEDKRPKINTAIITPDETINSIKEKETQENNDTVLIAGKNEESTDYTNEEKNQEKKETIIADVKKDESIDSTNEEQPQENKDTTLIASNNAESTNSTKEEQPQENKDTTLIASNNGESTNSTDEEQAPKKNDTIQVVGKKDENINSLTEEVAQEKKETIVADEKNNKTTDSIDKEQPQENKDTALIADNNNESIDSADEEQAPKKNDTIQVASKKDENINSLTEEVPQEKKETIIAAATNDKTIDSTNEDQVPKTNDTFRVADKDEELPNENKDSTLSASNNDENINSNNEEQNLKNNDTTKVASKIHENVESLNDEIPQEKKETIVASLKKDESNNSTIDEHPQSNKETGSVDVNNKEKTITPAIAIDEDQQQQKNNKEDNEEQSEDVVPLVAKKDVVPGNEKITTSEIKKDENQDESKDALVQENKILSQKIEALEQKYNQRFDSILYVIKDLNKAGNKSQNSTDILKKISKDEILISNEEGKNQENQETKTDQVKMEGNNVDSIVAIDGEKTQKNENIVPLDKIGKNTDSTIEEKSIENENSIAVIDETDKNIDSTNEGQPKENENTIIDSNKTDKNTDSTTKEQPQENENTIVDINQTDKSGDSTIEEQPQENNETIQATDKKNENSDDSDKLVVPVNNETIVATHKKSENANSNNFSRYELEGLKTDKKEENIEPAKDEKPQENMETTSADKQNKSSENEIPDVASVKQSNNSNSTEETDQEQKGTNLDADKQNDTANSTNELNDLAVVKQSVNSNATEETHQEQKETNIDADKQNDSSTEELKSPTLKEETSTVANPNDSSSFTGEQKESQTKTLLPDRFKKFDKDLNNVISYDEINKMIDAFFDDDPNVKAEDISSVIDYFFGD